MTFLLDQGLPRATVTELAIRGLTAEHVGTLGMATATDEEILEAARDRDAVVVTLDADFHALLAMSKSTTPSVIRIRIEGLKASDVANILEQVIATAASDVQAGAAVSVTLTGIRVRNLPLV
jgi:predicted nuclease of predicted toxin-antitoxin system